MEVRKVLISGIVPEGKENKQFNNICTNTKTPGRPHSVDKELGSLYLGFRTLEKATYHMYIKSKEAEQSGWP
eukprot:11297837-Heterocapsa_arctica.AAC.1